jgi:putative phosphoribosyl transferase
MVAKKLSTPNFDILIPRKLPAPYNEELAIGATMEDGSTYLNETIADALKISQEYIEKVKLEQIEEIKRRKAVYRKPGLKYDFNDKILILVDDGAATGATIIASARWARKNHKPRVLVAALPVAPKDVVSLLKDEVDYVEVVTSPPISRFKSVQQYYQEFNQATDEQVIQIMKSRNLIQ